MGPKPGLPPFREAAAVVTYRKSWRRSLPRLILGLLASIFPGIYLSFALLLVLHAALFLLAATHLAIGTELVGALRSRIVYALLWGATSLWVYFVLSRTRRPCLAGLLRRFVLPRGVRRWARELSRPLQPGVRCGERWPLSERVAFQTPPRRITGAYPVPPSRPARRG
jgi:hypothetical protein